MKKRFFRYSRKWLANHHKIYEDDLIQDASTLLKTAGSNINYSKDEKKTLMHGDKSLNHLSLVHRRIKNQNEKFKKVREKEETYDKSIRIKALHTITFSNIENN